MHLLQPCAAVTTDGAGTCLPLPVREILWEWCGHWLDGWPVIKKIDWMGFPATAALDSPNLLDHLINHDAA